MSPKITPQFGEAVPPAPRHSVTVQMGDWQVVERYGDDPFAIVAQFNSVYPRMRPHRDIVQLAAAVLQAAGEPDSGCYLFPSLQSARECIDFVTSSRRNKTDKRPIPAGSLAVRIFAARDVFFAVTFPPDQQSLITDFWGVAGVGVSSRFAEANLSHLRQLVEIPNPDTYIQARVPRWAFDTPAHETLRQSILTHLNRALLNPQQRPSSKDIYLYQTGMAAIFKSHTYMLDQANSTTIVFGTVFSTTLLLFQEIGPRCSFFGLGTDQDLSHLETTLEEERQRGRKVQAIWAEVPSNPLLITPNLARLRRLADEYDVILALDDTIGSWANIDIMPFADLTVTSLSKSFNGRADVLAGCAILNPASRVYCQLKTLFDQHYIPELYADDAAVIERNSRDYLDRTATMNRNASALVDYLQKCASDPSSAVTHVFYPSVSPSRAHFEGLMRRPTPDFLPGYGCLFSVELRDMSATQAFYDTLNVYKSVHLGAPFTLAFAYTMCTYKTKLGWAAASGLRPTQIRIAAGLEDTVELLEDFRIAVEAANRFVV